MKMVDDIEYTWSATVSEPLVAQMTNVLERIGRTTDRSRIHLLQEPARIETEQPLPAGPISSRYGFGTVWLSGWR